MRTGWSGMEVWVVRDDITVDTRDDVSWLCVIL